MGEPVFRRRKTYDCRFEDCSKTFTKPGGLFYHESCHDAPVRTVPYPDYRYRRDNYTEARTAVRIRDNMRCQLPNCDHHFNPADDPETAVDERREIQCHHIEDRNHPDYLILLCESCHDTCLTEITDLRQLVTPLAESGIIVCEQDKVPAITATFNSLWPPTLNRSPGAHM